MTPPYASISELTTEAGGVLCFLNLAPVSRADSSESFIGMALSYLLANFHSQMVFGPCVQGSVFELKSVHQPSCSLIDGTLEVDLGPDTGHFHLAVGPSQAADKRRRPFGRTLAAFSGQAGLLTEAVPVHGFRLWNNRNEQCFNIFFSSEAVWLDAVAIFVALAKPEHLSSCPEAPPSGLLAAWSADTPQARMLFNLRLLYSEAFERVSRAFLSTLPPETQKLLTLLPPGVIAERKARLANLFQYFWKNSRVLRWLMDEEQLKLALSMWVSTPDFWLGRGRNLMESFCLYLYPRLQLRSPHHAELVRVEGVMAGIAQAGAASPWNGDSLALDHRVSHDGQRYVECFSSPFQIIDDDGGLNPSFLLAATPRTQCIRILSEGLSVTVTGH